MSNPQDLKVLPSLTLTPLQEQPWQLWESSIYNRLPLGSHRRSQQTLFNAIGAFTSDYCNRFHLQFTVLSYHKEQENEAATLDPSTSLKGSSGHTKACVAIACIAVISALKKLKTTATITSYFNYAIFTIIEMAPTPSCRRCHGNTPLREQGGYRGLQAQYIKPMAAPARLIPPLQDRGLDLDACGVSDLDLGSWPEEWDWVVDEPTVDPLLQLHISTIDAPGSAGSQLQQNQSLQPVSEPESLSPGLSDTSFELPDLIDCGMFGVEVLPGTLMLNGDALTTGIPQFDTVTLLAFPLTSTFDVPTPPNANVTSPPRAGLYTCPDASCFKSFKKLSDLKYAPNPPLLAFPLKCQALCRRFAAPDSISAATLALRSALIVPSTTAPRRALRTREICAGTCGRATRIWPSIAKFRARSAAVRTKDVITGPEETTCHGTTRRSTAGS